MTNSEARRKMRELLRGKVDYQTLMIALNIMESLEESTKLKTIAELIKK